MNAIKQDPIIAMNTEISELRSDLIISENRANKLLHLFLETDHKAYLLKQKVEKHIIERNSWAVIAIVFALMLAVQTINIYYFNQG